MAWPPPTLPTNRTNATPQLDTHAADHNAANQAINDIVAQLTNPGAYRSHGGVSTVVTDNWGTAVISTAQGVPANAKIVGAVAICGQRDFPVWLVLNHVDIPLGSNACAFKVCRTDGLVTANSPIEVAWQITYTL